MKKERFTGTTFSADEQAEYYLVVKDGTIELYGVNIERRIS